MAARANTAGGTGDRSARRARVALLRLLTAAFAGGTALLLWSGTAGAAGTEAPAPAPAPTATHDAGLLGGLVGDGGALTPVVDLVDATTGTLVGSKPVGQTVETVATTVDPVVAPVATPVTEAADPVLAPVLDTVGGATDAVASPISGSLPGTPVIPGTPLDPTDPTDPELPPVVDPTGLLPELPPVVPSDPTAGPGTTPGTGSNPPTTIAPAAVGSDARTPLALAAGIERDRADGAGAALVAAGDPAHSPAATGSSSPASSGGTSDGAAEPSGGAPGSAGATGPEGSVPSPCTGQSRTAPGGGAAPAFLSAAALCAARAATLLDVVTPRPPASAPPAGPEVAPD